MLAFNKINKNRRNLLKFLIIGGGALLLGKVLDFRSFGFLKSSDNLEKEYSFENFRIAESKKELVISDRTGEKILIIDK